MKIPDAAPVLVAALGAEVALAAPVVVEVSFAEFILYSCSYCDHFTDKYLYTNRTLSMG